MGSGITNREGEQKGKAECDPHSQESSPGIVRNIPNIGRDDCRLALVEVSHHSSAKMEDRPKQSEDSEEDHDVHPAKGALDLGSAKLCCCQFHLISPGTISERATADNLINVTICRSGGSAFERIVIASSESARFASSRRNE